MHAASNPMTTTYRSIGYEHSCPAGGCAMCKEAYQPPPANPRDYPPCCQYYENGHPVHVVICDVPAKLIANPRKRPGSARSTARPTRSVTLKPARGGKKTAAKGIASPKLTRSHSSGTLRTARAEIERAVKRALGKK
jgi:hypothetical protein